jgi:hypothetical protein
LAAGLAAFGAGFAAFLAAGFTALPPAAFAAGIPAPRRRPPMRGGRVVDRPAITPASSFAEVFFPLPLSAMDAEVCRARAARV